MQASGREDERALGFRICDGKSDDLPDGAFMGVVNAGAGG